MAYFKLIFCYDLFTMIDSASWRKDTVLKQFENAYIKVTHTQKGKSYKIICVNTIFKSYRKFSETKNKKTKKEKEKIDKT